MAATTYSKVILSGSTNGLGIVINNTATPGDAIHTAHASDTDEIWLWAWNSSSLDQLLTIEFGGVTDPDNIIEVTVPAQDGLYLVVPGLPLTNSLAVAAFGADATSNPLTIYGYVNRIT